MRGKRFVGAALLCSALSAPAWAAYGLADGGFDAQGNSVSTYCYFNVGCPSGVWSGGGSGFIKGQNGDWGNPPPPSPSVALFLQSTGTLSQTFTATASGNFRLVWYDANRPNTGGQLYQVKINNVVVATFAPTSTAFVQRYSNVFNITSGSSYTVTFVGTDSSDKSVFLDSVDLVPATETTSYGYDVFGRLVGTGRSGGPLDGYRDDAYLDAADNRSTYYVRDIRQGLPAGQSATSPDGRTQLAMQSDGNLVVYFNGSALWSSGTSGSGGTRAVLQSDGNLVVYTNANASVWQSGTSQKYGALLAIQNDGNVVIYDVSRTPVWQTGTGGHS